LNTMPGQDSGRLQEFAPRVAELIRQLAEAQITVPEDSTVLSFDHPSVTDAIRLVGETVVLIGELDSESDDRLTDLAFLARIELGGAREDLRDVAGRKKTWQALGQAASSMSKAERALAALEREIYAAMEKEPPRRPGVLAESLEIRAHYAHLRAWLLQHDEDSAPSLMPRFAEAADQLRRLQKLDIYPLMRIQDRKQVRSLLDRIEAAIERGIVDDDVRAIWQDLGGAAELLLQINHRHELVDHDRDHLESEEPVSIGESEGDGEVVAFADHHRRLLGRDRALDEVLIRPWHFTLAQAEERLHALKMRLRGGP
jgi:hypothetical protein